MPVRRTPRHRSGGAPAGLLEADVRAARPRGAVKASGLVCLCRPGAGARRLQPARAGGSFPARRNRRIPGPPSVGEIRAGEVRAGEFRACKVRAGEARPGEVRPGEVRADEFRACKVRASEVRVAEVRAVEVYANEDRAGKVRAPEVR